MRKSLAALATVAAITALAGCSTATADDGKLQVVASTNVYGSIAAQIGGDHVAVTSLIDSAAKDPHGYEATARDRLAVQKADLVIENGGGYDAFMDELIDGSDAVVITAAEFSHDYPDAVVDDHDHDADHADEHAGHSHIEGFNEHVWFDVHTVSHVAEQIAAAVAWTADAVAAGALSALPVTTYALDDVVAAHESVRGGAVGKVVLAP